MLEMNIVTPTDLLSFNATTATTITSTPNSLANISADDGLMSNFSDLIVNATAIAYEFTTNWLASAGNAGEGVEGIGGVGATQIASENNSIFFASPNAGNSSSGSNSFADILIATNISGASTSTSTSTPTSISTSPWTSPSSLSSTFAAMNTTAYEYHACDPENPHFNCTRERFLEYRQGPQQLPLQQALLVTIIFGGIFITSIVGNVLVCVVIIRHSTLHTATNYYLFSLAVSDLLYLLLGLPSEIVIFWHQYPYLFGLPFCKIRAFISEACTYVSVLTIVAFSMERFLAICHPLHLYAMSGFKRALRIIAILWIVSFISAIPFGLLSGIHYEKYPVDNSIIWESAFCSMPTPKEFPLFELSFCIFFIIPMLLIIILYGRMGAQIRSRTMQQLGVQQGSMHKESRHQQSRRAVIRMLAAVVITFFVCWLPFHIQRLFYRYAQDYQYFQEINEIMFSITGFAYYVSCTINPILYNVMSHRYRVAFKDILCGKRKSVYYNNGFARDQSSFRETTIASSLGATGGGGNVGYDRVHSVRVRSVRHVNSAKERDSIKGNNAQWQKRKTEFNVPSQKQDKTEDPPQSLGTNVVVVDNGLNGRPKVYTEDEAAQENLINKSNETCI